MAVLLGWRGGDARLRPPAHPFVDIGSSDPVAVSRCSIATSAHTAELARRPLIPALSGFRLLAAVWIFVYHWRGPLELSAQRVPSVLARQVVVALLDAGYVAVSALFVLSGFVLAFRYPQPLARRERGRFWVARLARVYPGHLAALALYAPLFVARAMRDLPTVSWQDLWAYASLTSAWLPDHVFAVQAPGWSTSAVAFFSLAFPFLVAALARRSRGELLAGAVVAWLCGLVAPAVLTALDVPDVDGSYWALFVRYNPALRLAEFASGVALGLWWRRTRVAPPGWVPVAALCGWIALSASPLPRAILHNGALTPVVALILVGLAGDRGPLGRVLGSHPLSYLGKAGFGIFILQTPVGVMVNLAQKLLGFAPETAVSCVVTFFLTLLAAVASLRLLEQPSQRALRAAYDRWLFTVDRGAVGAR